MEGRKKGGKHFTHTPPPHTRRHTRASALMFYVLPDDRAFLSG
jgi:hypothetical protein